MRKPGDKYLPTKYTISSFLTGTRQEIKRLETTTDQRGDYVDMESSASGISLILELKRIRRKTGEIWNNACCLVTIIYQC